MTSIKKPITAITLILCLLVGCSEMVDNEKVTIQEATIQEATIQEATIERALILQTTIQRDPVIATPACVNFNQDPVDGNVYPETPVMKCNNAERVFKALSSDNFPNAHNSAFLLVISHVDNQVISLINDETMNRRPMPVITLPVPVPVPVPAPIQASAFHAAKPASLTRISKQGNPNTNCSYIVAEDKALFCDNKTGTSIPEITISTELHDALVEFITDNFPPERHLTTIDFVFLIDGINKEVKYLVSQNYTKFNLNVLNSDWLIFHSLSMNYSMYQENPDCYYKIVNGQEKLVCSKL